MGEAHYLPSQVLLCAVLRAVGVIFSIASVSVHPPSCIVGYSRTSHMQPGAQVCADVRWHAGRSMPYRQLCQCWHAAPLFAELCSALQ